MPPRALRLFPLLNATELNPATSSSFFTLQIVASRRRIHAQESPHRTTRGKKTVKSGSSIPTGISRYILYLAFYLTFQILTQCQ